MPELPEVETVRRGLAPVMEGRRVLNLVANRPDLRFPLPDRFVHRAKFLCADLSGGETLIMHLGMSGRFDVDGQATAALVHDTVRDPAHDHVVFAMEGGVRITYNDPRRFGFMEVWPTAGMADYPRLAALGPEPLANGFHAAYLAAALRGRQTPVKAALLDQKVVAGLGNIYVCEALFRAGISPRRKAAGIGPVRAARLAAAINAVIAEAIEAGGSSLRDFAATDGALGYFQHSFRVYDRENQACTACRTPVSRIVQAGRSTFFCGRCQR